MLKVPEEYSHLEKLFDNFERMKFLINHKFNIILNGKAVDVAEMSPIIVAIYHYSGMMDEYNSIKMLAIEAVGKKKTNTGIFGFIIKYDMGLKLTDQYWNDRNVKMTSQLISDINNSDDKYIKYILESNKFYKEIDLNMQNLDFINTLGECEKIFNIGEKIDKFLKIKSNIFKIHNDFRFVSKELQDIFFY